VFEEIDDCGYKTTTGGIKGDNEATMGVKGNYKCKKDIAGLEGMWVPMGDCTWPSGQRMIVVDLGRM